MSVAPGSRCPGRGARQYPAPRAGRRRRGGTPPRCWPPAVPRPRPRGACTAPGASEVTVPGARRRRPGPGRRRRIDPDRAVRADPPGEDQWRASSATCTQASCLVNSVPAAGRAPATEHLLGDRRLGGRRHPRPAPLPPSRCRRRRWVVSASMEAFPRIGPRIFPRPDVRRSGCEYKRRLSPGHLRSRTRAVGLVATVVAVGGRLALRGLSSAAEPTLEEQLAHRVADDAGRGELEEHAAHGRSLPARRRQILCAAELRDRAGVRPDGRPGGSDLRAHMCAVTNVPWPDRCGRRPAGRGLVSSPQAIRRPKAPTTWRSARSPGSTTTCCSPPAASTTRITNGLRKRLAAAS